MKPNLLKIQARRIYGRAEPKYSLIENQSASKLS
jgi:hypothetical protein